ncbi:MAG: phospholipase [Rickettsiales bacterium]|nr:phospholipase [Rickettsiales bacterium]
MTKSITTLEGPLTKPASGGPAKQLIVFLHGVGADGFDLIGLASAMAEAFPDAQFMSPHAPFPCDMAPNGHQWFSLQDRNPDALFQGVQEAEPILNAYLDEQLTMLGMDDSQLAVVGFSQGTMTALHTMLRRAKPCAGIVGFSGALIGSHVLADDATAKPPVCLVHGEMDDVVPFAAMEMAREGLEEAGINVETHAREGLAHGIDQPAIDIASAFLQRCFSNAQSNAA